MSSFRYTNLKITFTLGHPITIPSLDFVAHILYNTDDAKVGSKVAAYIDNPMADTDHVGALDGMLRLKNTPPGVAPYILDTRSRLLDQERLRRCLTRHWS